jgi:predicted transcriptional regulator
LKPRKEVEEKIIETLRIYGELNITRLSRLTGLHYRVLQKYLSSLVERGIVIERRYSRLRLFRLADKYKK